MTQEQPQARLSRNLVEGLVRSTNDHAFICMDPRGIVIDWLGGAERIFGYTADEVIGQPLGMMFTPEDKLRSFDTYELEVARLDSKSDDERWHVRKDGTRIWTTGTVSAIRNEAGELLGFIKVVRDRTDLRTQLDSLERHAEVMRERQERTHRFLKTLGHELRNPLAPLLTATVIIGRLSHEPRVLNAVKIVTQQAEAIRRLADDLTDVSRLEVGKFHLKLEKLDLRALLRDAVEALQPAALDKRLTLRAILPGVPLEIEADRERLQQVVLNLLGNAMKYTPEGGTIWVKATQEGPDMVFRVQDTGIGISPEVLPRIFELFTQQAEAEDMVPGGLGIGLAMVRDLVELHGGSVQANSAGVGKGAEFTVRLPLIPRPQMHPAGGADLFS